MKKLFIVGMFVALVGVTRAQIQTTIYHLQFDRDSTGASTWVDSGAVTVSGIVTAGYGVTGSRNFFLEMSQGGPWSGIMVYIPSSAGDFPVNVGDSLTVTGSVSEYYDNTELIVSDTTNIVRNGTATVPDPAIISTAHLDTSATSSYGPDSAEAYEGVLVKVLNAFVTDTTAPHDGFQITDGDGYAIVYNSYSYTPHVGDPLNVTGIVHTHYDWYKIRPRSVDDIEVLSQHISVVYSTSRTGLNVQFTRPVNLSEASNPDNYIITPSLSVVSATVDSVDSSLVHLETGEQTDAQEYQLSVQNLGAPDTEVVTFYGGFTPIFTIQHAYVDTDTVTYATQWYGRVVTITGVISGEREAFLYPFYFVQQGRGPWSGIQIYDPQMSYMTTRGDSVIISGTVTEYGGMTELINILYYDVVSSGHQVTPTVVHTGDLNLNADTTAESYESVLIQTGPAAVITNDANNWQIDDGTGTAYVDNSDAYSYTPTVGDSVVVIGNVRYIRGNFNINPRDDNDVSVVFVGVNETPHVGLKSFSVLPVVSYRGNFTLRFAITTPTKVKVDLYNVSGQKVKDVLNKTLNSGLHDVKVNLSSMTPGVYFFKVKTDSGSVLRKVIILR